MHTIDLEPFQHSGANITGVRLVSPDDAMVVQVTEFFAEKYAERMAEERESKENKENDDDDDDDEDEDKNDDDDENGDEEEKEEEEDKVLPGLTADFMRLDTALTFDSVLLFSEVVKLDGEGARSKNIKCDDDSGLRAHGFSDSMKMKTIPPLKGLSGDLHFDQKGHRSNFQVEVVELTTEGLTKVGTWNTSEGENF